MFKKLLFLNLLLSVSVAQAAENNFANWVGVITQGKFDQHWGWYMELQTRLNDGYDVGEAPDGVRLKGNRLMIRPALRYLPFGDNSLQLAAGYAWTPNLSPTRDEQRIWQQVFYQKHFGNWLLAERLRFEQRFIQDTNKEVSLRLRYFQRIQYHFTEDKKYALAVWDEALFGLNDVTNGPQSGFDQNRVFVGPNIAVSNNIRAEFGYLNAYINKTATQPAIFNHTLLAYLYLDF